MPDEPDNLVLSILREMRTEMGDMRSDMSEMRSDMNDMRADLRGLREEMNDRFASVYRRLDAVEERVDDVKDISTTALWYVTKIYAERDDEKAAAKALEERLSALENASPPLPPT